MLDMDLSHYQNDLASYFSLPQERLLQFASSEPDERERRKTSTTHQVVLIAQGIHSFETNTTSDLRNLQML